jgi:hypothetical protein
MVAAGYVEVRDLLCVTPPSIPEASQAMTQLVELPPAEAGLAPHRHCGPVFGYVLEGRTLFELERTNPERSLQGKHSGSREAAPCTPKMRTWTHTAGPELLQHLPR